MNRPFCWFVAACAAFAFATDVLAREKFRLGATDQVVPLHGDCPRFGVFNFCANRRSHPVSWLKALSAKVWVSCNWQEQQADAEIFLKLAETGLLGKGNVYPTVFPLARMEKARAERAAWLDAVAPATCDGAHVVVTVPSVGKTFVVACVDAGDEKMRVLSETKYET